VAVASMPRPERRAAFAAGSRPATATRWSERGAEVASQRATSVPMLPRPAMPTARVGAVDGFRVGSAMPDARVTDVARPFHGDAGRAAHGHVADGRTVMGRENRFGLHRKLLALLARPSRRARRPSGPAFGAAHAVAARGCRYYGTAHECMGKHMEDNGN